MFDRSTDRARKVMGLARQEAQRFKHDYIGTEHLALALMRVNCPNTQSIFEDAGVDLEEARLAIGELMDGPKAAHLAGQLPFTRGAKRVLELAYQTSVALRHDWIDCPHLLLGLLEEPDGIGGNVLRSMGLTETAVRAALASASAAWSAQGPERDVLTGAEAAAVLLRKLGVIERELLSLSCEVEELRDMLR